MMDTSHGPVAALKGEGLYRAHVHGLYAFVYAHVGNREAAEDITSDVFIKTLPHIDRARSECSSVAWLYQVARTTVANYWRQGHARHMVTLEEVLAAGTEPPTAPNVAWQAGAVARARALLGRLPENYRRVLSHRLLDGASVAETARLMNLSESNVKELQHRALTCAVRLQRGDSDNG